MVCAKLRVNRLLFRTLFKMSTFCGRDNKISESILYISEPDLSLILISWNGFHPKRPGTFRFYIFSRFLSVVWTIIHWCRCPKSISFKRKPEVRELLFLDSSVLFNYSNCVRGNQIKDFHSVTKLGREQECSKSGSLLLEKLY